MGSAAGFLVTGSMEAVTPFSAARTESAAPSQRNEWRERSARLYKELEGASRALVRRAYRGAFGEDELDDIYSNAWLGTLRALALRHADLTDEEIRSYVFAAVAHQASREIRRRRRKPTAPLDAADGRADGSPTPDERVAVQESSRVTRDLLASLPLRRRAVILLRYGWGLDPQQVCSLIDGLSPRAYRKEITRGVNELTEKVRAFERGDWCAEREQVITAYATGTADRDKVRQAEAHLAHCRECRSFVSRLTGRLHDLAGLVLAPAALEALQGDASMMDRISAIAERAQTTVASIVGRASTNGSDESAAAVATGGGVRGTGAVGAGVLAKLAGAGAATKVTAACAGSVVASACIAAGVATIEVGSPDRGSKHVESGADPEVAADQSSMPAPDALPSQVDGGAIVSATPASNAASAGGPSDASKPAAGALADKDSGADSALPVEVATPPATQEFGVEAAAASAPAPSGSLADGGVRPEGAASGTDVRQQFGP